MFYPGFDSEPFRKGVTFRDDNFGRLCLHGIFDGRVLNLGAHVVEDGGTAVREIPELSEKTVIVSGPNGNLSKEDYRTMNGVYESWGRDALDKVLRSPEFVSDICREVRKAISEMDYAFYGRRGRR